MKILMGRMDDQDQASLRFSEESLLVRQLIHRKSLEQILIKIACDRASLSDKLWTPWKNMIN